ncbi:hypothetical protein EG68_05548 [Paragonimus skrjabini miyazakii]|uniref:Regulator of microtubule dynamics protein 1 n=1 Tax=Paragonimus skrjabini miyazakii TaxID=59628 RepID=A0A8S9Z1Y9_9TREM|nr:hypothetical protein EG68_05548 [Paragonimus skrjabini miyazakii]
MDAQLKQADKLVQEHKYKECETFLEQMQLTPEVAWRRAQVQHLLVAQMSTKPTKDHMKSVYTKGLEDAKAGVQLDPNHANCLTWQGICVNYLAKLEGTNERIKNAYVMQELWLASFSPLIFQPLSKPNLQKALKTDPKNHLTLNCLGVWCFTVTDLPSVKRQFAKTFFTRPPESTYSEALDYLLKSEQLAPKPLMSTMITLAKCYERMHNKEKAKEYCNKVMNLPNQGFEDTEAKEDAEKMLKKL